MARRRYYRPNENWNRGPRINDQIRKSPVRLIDENKEMVGVVETADALERAREVGLDLVEIAGDSDPPVCQILDYGKFKYEQSKKDKANKARSKQTEIKEVRLGRSMKIDPHDIQIRLNQARRFLMEGHKVQIVQNFRGREMIHRSRGFDRMKDIVATLEDIAKVEMEPRLAGRRMTMLLAPERAKIEGIKRREAQDRDAAGGKKKKRSGPASEATSDVTPENTPAETASQPVSEPTPKPAPETAPETAPEPIEAPNS